MKRQGFRAALRDVWRLTLPYFRSEERWSARLILIAILALNFGQVGLTVLLNAWRGAFYNALEAKDVHGFTNLIFLWRDNDDGFMPGFVAICAVLIPAAIYSTYLTQWLQIRWRRWMTARMLGNWLSERAYYTIALQHAAEGPPDASGERGSDNPDQRIAEDLDKFTDTTLNLGLDLLSTVVSLISFAQILYTLSGPITLYGVTIPGYMLFVAIAYAVIGTTLTHLVGRPLIGFEFNRQKVEADFRFALVRVRENVEGVALYGGEASEREGLLQRFSAIVANWHNLIRPPPQAHRPHLRLRAGRRHLPHRRRRPPLLRGRNRARRPHAHRRRLLRGAKRPLLVRHLLPVPGRLARHRRAPHHLPGRARHRPTLAGAGIHLQPGPGDALALQDVTLALPDGRILLEHAGLDLPRHRSTVISGRSGSGKSTLFRAMAGIWPFGHGNVLRPDATQLFLPQRPYIPLGTLRHAVTYPGAAALPDEAIHQALADAGLAALTPELDIDQPWAQRLSGGEQQRLAVARALLLRPDWLFMDEATASLDPEAEAELYAMLRTRLPGTTIISIAHPPRRCPMARPEPDFETRHPGGISEVPKAWRPYPSTTTAPRQPPPAPPPAPPDMARSAAAPPRAAPAR